MTSQQLKKELLKFDNVTLSDIIIAAISGKKELKNAILEQVNDRVKMQGFGDSAQQKIRISDAILDGYWKTLKKIVKSFNKYGGGPAKDENKAYDLFKKLIILIQKEVFSTPLRMKVLEEVLEEHKLGNSGFDDDLDDLANSLCVYKRDWEALVNYYQEEKKSSSYYAKKVAQIRKDKLSDEQAF